MLGTIRITRRTMLKLIIFITSIITLTGCVTNDKTVDYFGQTEPKSIPIIFGEDIISKKNRFEHGISFTPDKRELAFGVLDENAVGGAIYYSEKTNNKWTVPEKFEPLKEESVYLPYFTPNGKSLLYTQSIPDSNRSYITDIWRLDKKDGNWGSAKKIQTPISSASREATASMTNSGTIYFSSNRNCQGIENCFTADLFNSKLVDNKYESAENILALNSPSDEESIFISPKEDYIIFCRYTDDKSFVDLYISYHDYDNGWTQPQILETSINSESWDRRPFVSIDNKYLFFTRLKIEQSKLIESDIYWVNTSKVFKPFVYNPIPYEALQVGKKFEIQVPDDYFKDINNDNLVLSINKNEFDWLEFNNKDMRLSGTPVQDGEYELVFTAVDKAGNLTNDRMKLIVEK